MAKEVGPDCTIMGTIKSVDEGEGTCVLYDEESDLEFTEIRLRPVLEEENDFLTIVPKVGTWALAIRIEDADDWMIIAVGQADKYRLKIGEATVELDSDGLLVKKQEDTLKQVVQLIIEAMQVIVVVQGTNPDYTKLTQALSKMNNVLR